MRHLVAAVAAAALLALTGCTGGSGPTPSPPGQGLTESPRVGSGSASTAPTPSTPTPARPTAERPAPGPADQSPGTAATEVPSIGGLPDETELATAAEDVAELSLHQLAGQLVVAAYPGTDPESAAALVRRHHLGGVITLGDNVPADPAERVPALTGMTASVTRAVTEDGRSWPAFIGVDQEGGPITRIGEPLDRQPAAMALGAARDPELAADVALASGEQLRALGYTVVFAPVADVTTGPDDPTIGARSPGADPGLVTRIATAQAQGYVGAGLVPVAKHFPGHGSVSGDTHLGQVVQEAGVQTLRERDLAPFAGLAREGLPAVMSAHIVLEAVDAELPATLSPDVLTGLLREELDFQGLVVTDALNMAAVTDGRGAGEAAVLAVQAGADVLLMPPDPGGVVDALVAAVGDGTLSRERLEESATRMVATLRHQESAPVPDPGAIGSGDDDLAVQAAGAAITQLSGPCGEPLVGSGIEVVGGTERDRELLRDVAADAGLSTGGGDVVALLGAPAYQAGGGGGGTAAAQGDVVVALDVPYPLGGSGAGTALLAAYGRDRATFQALVAVLQGEQEAGGALPVVVGEHPVGTGCPTGP